MSREPEADAEPIVEVEEAAGEMGVDSAAEESLSELEKDPRALRFEQDLWGNLERINQVVAKGIDLAESSLALGARMVSGLGKLSEQQILERVRETEGAGPGYAESALAEPSASEATHSQPPVEGPGVANRAPLQAGSEVRVPFSLTNDSAEAARKVEVSLQELVGQSSGARLAAKALSVEPSEAMLLPLDFEKFVIKGKIPSKTTPDTYLGAIVVQGDEVLTIPLQLSVT
jgi:hypothetical protein